MEAEAAKQIRLALREALAKFGTAGEVFVDGDSAELRSGGVPVAVSMELLGEQWALLPPEHRDRRIQDIARRLSEAARARPDQPILKQATNLPIRGVLMAVGAIVALLVIYFGFSSFIQPWLAGPKDEAAIPGGRLETEEQRVARVSRVCEAARTRLATGASMGAFDTEGWQVELWVARASDKDNAAMVDALNGFIADGTLKPELLNAPVADGAGGDSGLGIERGSVEVVPGLADDRAVGARMRMTGDFVKVYLDPKRGKALISVAEVVALKSQATTAALYAKCAHLPYHDAGAWFFGRSPAGVATALVLGVGAYSEAPLASVPTDASAVFQRFQSLETNALEEAARAEGGVLRDWEIDADAKALALTFPVGASRRPVALGKELMDRSAPPP